VNISLFSKLALSKKAKVIALNVSLLLWLVLESA
jgi:hypothetical protein